MKRLLVSISICSVLFLCSTFTVFAIQGDDIIGTWITGDQDTRVEIFKKDNLYFGKIVASKSKYEPGIIKKMDADGSFDINHSDKAMRSRPILGLELLTDFSFNGKKWVGGKVYDPKNGKTYKCKLTLSDDGKVLKVRGFVGVALFGRTTAWERADVYLKRELKFLGIKNTFSE
ncbi:MAG: DUF2147 domain-containing protein [bacterium]|nr:DUF2147 domain-containing protein [bacterium]